MELHMFPRDVWMLLLRELNARDIAAARLACRPWNSTLCAALSKLDLRRKQQEQQQRQHYDIERLIHIFHGVTAMKLAGPAAGPTILGLGFCRIRKLVVERADLGKPMLAALGKLPLLSSLLLRVCSLQDASPLQDLTSLTRLMLRHCELKGGTSVAHNIPPLQHLRHLTLEHTVPLQQEEEVLRGLAMLPTITTLELALYNAPSVEAQESLRKLARLEHICISIARGPWAPQTLPHMAALLAPLPALKHLHLKARTTTSISDEDLIVVSAAAPQLQSLSLDVVVTRAPALIDPPQAPPWTITPLGVSALSNLRLLSHLSLAGCSISKEGLTEMSQLQSLTSLDLSGCSQVDDALLFKLCTLTQLQQLVLSSCPMVSDIGVGMVARALRGLTHVDLSGCGRFLTDTGVAHLAALPGLRTLALSSCRKLTDAAVQALAQSPPPPHHPEDARLPPHR